MTARPAAISRAIVLALETATPVVSLALRTADGVIHENMQPPGAQASEWLAPAAQLLLAGQGLKPRDLHALAVGAGPGAFTGLRVGYGFAKGLALGLEIPLIEIPSPLSIMTQAAEQGIPGVRLVALLDARRGEVYGQRYHREGARWFASGGPFAAKPDSLAEHLTSPADQWMAAGSGADVWSDVFRRLGLVLLPGVFPRARDLIAPALESLAAGAFRPVDQCEPVYLRSPVD
ncbi:MAG: tRNA threonylcarbamoyladenosine biosynthesis protein TsaB [Myxococcota bacterium]|nr:tRNA threonylcarbamoyladenosine biosynthesis protein TsaB [Myxococcota bacterium]